MPCQNALTTKIMTLKPADTVAQALKDMKKNKASFAPVVEDGELVGVFSLGRVLQNTLPVSVTLGGEGRALGGRPVRIPAAPGLGRRLQKSMTGTVAEIMERSVAAVTPDTPLEAAIRHIAQRAEPVCVVDGGGAFLGVVTDETVMAALEKDGGAA